MNSSNPTLNIVGCDPDQYVLDVSTCRPCSTETDIQTTGATVCNTQNKVRFFKYTVTPTPSANTPKQFHATLQLQNFDVNTDEIVNFQTYLTV